MRQRSTPSPLRLFRKWTQHFRERVVLSISTTHAYRWASTPGCSLGPVRPRPVLFLTFIKVQKKWEGSSDVQKKGCSGYVFIKIRYCCYCCPVVWFTLSYSPCLICRQADRVGFGVQTKMAQIKIKTVDTKHLKKIHQKGRARDCRRRRCCSCGFCGF